MKKPGEEKSIVFDEAGSATVRCAIHPKMKLNLNVK
jgi:plastocyanin